MTRRGYLLALALALLVALIAQVGLIGAGLFRITSDESARILTAWHLTGANALEPFLWPPFYKLFVGSALKLYPNIFLTPRILVDVAGLLSLLALARLATALFQDRLISVVTVILALLAPQRLIFSVVPLSDIYYFLFIIMAAALTVEWLRQGRRATLFLACFCVLLSESVRFESGLFAAFIEFMLLYRCLIRRQLGFVDLCVASLILFCFPVLWVLNSYAWYGSISNLGVVTQQFVGEFGRNYFFAIKWSALRFFIQDIIWNPLTIPGLAALVLLSLRDRVIGLWALLFEFPLLVFSAVTVVTLSVPTAATWRISGVWSLMMLPFDAFIAVRLGQYLLNQVRLARPLVASLLVLAILPMGVRSLWYARDGLRNNETLRPHQERMLDRYLDAQLLEHPGWHGLVDSSTNLDYMDVLAFSRFPDRLILTGDGDPVLIGVYEPMQKAYAGHSKIADQLLDDHFGLAGGGSAKALAERDIHFLVVRNPAFLAALNASPLVAPVRRFNDWTVYGVKPIPGWTGAAIKSTSPGRPAG